MDHEFGKFRQRLQETSYGENDKKWFPKWLARYAAGTTTDGGLLPVTEQQVNDFSRSLLKSATPAWQRLQGVRTVEAYRDLVLESSAPCLNEMKTILGRFAVAEREASGPSVQDGQQIVGIIDPSEPALIQQMRRELRLRHKALETERAYIGWIMRFIRHCGSETLQAFGEAEIKSFLTELAAEGNVAVSTQDQAKSALLFLYQQVLSRELAFLDVTRSKKPKRLPVVLSSAEIAKVLPEFRGRRRLMFLVMYGAGLRHKECCRLRVKDVCFDDGHIIVRNGKGDKDRITVLPDCCRNDLIEQVEMVRRQHAQDLEAGFGRVYLPHALERKYPNENLEFGWQWVFPSLRLAKDPRSGERRRHHGGKIFLRTLPRKRSIVWASRKTRCPILCVTASRRICSKTALA